MPNCKEYLEISQRCKISQDICLYIDPQTVDMMTEKEGECPIKKGE